MNDLISVPFDELLEHVVDNRGKTCPTADLGIPLIATNCISNDYLYPQYVKVRYVDDDTYSNWFRGHPEPNDMIFVTKGTPGRVAWVPDPVDFCIAQDMVAIRPNSKKIYPKYLFAALRSAYIQDQIEGLHVGSLIPHFKKGDFGELHIPMPDEKMQKFIGNTYMDFSLKIDLLRCQNKTLEAIAKNIFRQTFIDNAQDNWQKTSLGDLVETNVSTIKKGYEHNTIQYLDTGSITRGAIDGYQEFDLEKAPSRAKRLVDHNDVIISTVRPNQEHYGIMKNPIDNLVVSTGFCVIKCTKIDPHFVYVFLTTDEMTEHLHVIAEASTSAYPSLKPSDIESLELKLPPHDLLDEFAEMTDANWKKIEKNYLQIKTLENLRDTLLPKLMSGEVRVQYDEAVDQTEAA